VEIKTRGSGLRGFGPETCSLHGFGPKFGSPGGLLDMLVSETVPRVGLIEYNVLPGSSIRICTPHPPPTPRSIRRDPLSKIWACRKLSTCWVRAAPAAPKTIPKGGGLRPSPFGMVVGVDPDFGSSETGSGFFGRTLHAGRLGCFCGRAGPGVAAGIGLGVSCVFSKTYGCFS
jgi:hypothetical protein